jgi:hypothetical protein
LIFIGASTVAAQPSSNQPVKPQPAAKWVLTQAQVVKPGKSTDTATGLLITGYEMRAKAQAQGPARVGAGDFTLRGTIFSPKQDMGDQKAGKYYMRGPWEITQPGARKSLRQTPDSIKGFFQAELTENPAVTAGPIEAKVISGPMPRRGGKSAAGVGTLVINAHAGQSASAPAGGRVTNNREGAISLSIR